MTPIPGKALELAFPNAAKDRHAFAGEAKSEEPMPFGAKLGPLNLPGQFNSANDNRFLAGRGRWGERPGEPLSISAISQMAIGVAGEKSIFGRKAHKPLHKPIGLVVGK